jgi:GTP-binding protein
MRARLVDLPGYGYARAPQTLRDQWRALVDAYVRSRPTLAGVVVIMDARHPLTPLDVQLLSKADKLSRAEQATVSKKFGDGLLFSSVTRQGVEACRDLLEQWLQQTAEIKSPR